MKTLSVTIRDPYGLEQTEMVGLRMAAIIMRLLDERKEIAAWPVGRAEFHWKDNHIELHITKIEARF